ncbi:piggyBac transposable element-derived protein 5 [Eublepharis macularius]|uniref:PiggyBac transposable element-derived protein 5 n=1 Tax=Eublepharis macularius TaxID=481883 RepID=A0AA97K6E3_EUBMA|nr:piggyBac transposable element-derived protein 5 [Eublepharis macularius]
MLSWLLPPMALHTHRGGLCRGEREAGLRGGGGGGGGGESRGAPSACLPPSFTEPLLLLGCCLRPDDPAERGLLLTPAGGMMAAGGGGPRQKALSLLEAARCRYESLQISDDVFGESGQDSSGNPFYSTTADSASEEEEDDERRAPEGGRGQRGRTGGRRGAKAAAEQQLPPAQGGSGASCLSPAEQPEEEEEEEEEDQRGWSRRLRDTPTPSFMESSGPTHKMPPAASAMDFFQLFVPDNVLKNMVVQTNMYAKKYQERFGSDDTWTDVTLTEMKAFLAYMISTSTHHCESVLSIWSSGFYSNKSIALIMTQPRFEKILKYFHIVAFRSSQTTHGLYKIQPFLDSLQHSFDSAFKPSQTQVLHEPLIDEDPIFIATCTERESRKRKKRKFSLWVRQCSSTGFICQIYVHLKEGSGAEGLDALKNKTQLHSMVAKSLCKNTAGKNYIIFTGPSITSLNLFEEFEKQEIYCCGLLSARKSDCTGLPPSMLNNPDVPQSRGQYRIKMKGNMSLICWYNKGYFRFLANAYSPVQEGVIIKRKSGEIPCPLAVEAFAAHLSYICKYDDKYSKYFISHKPNKTWQQVFWFAISIAINNAYILYKMSDAYHVKKYSRVQFGERLVKELLGLEDISPSH